jgi:polyhydroxyalkanoate synthesis repressor PhaR
MSTSRPTLVKKYGNRRLYDTELSRYVTLEELTEKVRAGHDVVVVDAKSGEDLTQATLLQIILETPASRLLPAPILARLIRMQDDALAEFFGRHVATALDLYLAARQGAQSMPMFPFAQSPMSAAANMARMFSQVPGWGTDPAAAAGYAAAPSPFASYGPVAPPPPPPQHQQPPAGAGEVHAMRGEIEALRRELQGLAQAAARPPKRATKAAPSKPAARARRK